LACKYEVLIKNNRGNIKKKKIILLYFVLLAAASKEGARGFALESGTATEQENKSMKTIMATTTFENISS
jgi:hypothetical protein